MFVDKKSVVSIYLSVEDWMKYLLCICAIMLHFPVYAEDIFPDIVEEEYKDSIEYLHEKEVVKWYPDGTFWPDRGVTRAEMVKIIFEPLYTEEEIGSWSNCFLDVFNQWYAPYVCLAKDKNIVRWYPDDTFKPDQPVTIAEWLKIALVAFDQSVVERQDERWFEPYIDFVHTAWIFSKFALDPDRDMTRAEMSYLVHQLLLEKEGELRFTSTRENYSLWCEERNMPSDVPKSLELNGIQRNFITSVGSKVRHDSPTKLVIAFHGRTSSNSEVRQYYKLEKAWDRDAIIVYPSWLPEWWPSRSRRDGGDPSDQLRDFALFDSLVEEFGDTYCIDKDQIYVVGHSLWAWFTNSLACARGDVIRASGSVWWSTTINACAWPVAAIIMHNPKDRLAWFSWGERARDQLLEQNNCWPETKNVWPAEWNCVEYTNCTSDAPVVWCPHTQDNAWWDGSYYPHTRPDFAGSTIWDFFEEHS